MISLFIAFEVWCLLSITGMELFTFNKTFILLLTILIIMTVPRVANQHTKTINKFIDHILNMYVHKPLLSLMVI